MKSKKSISYKISKSSSVKNGKMKNKNPKKFGRIFIVIIRIVLIVGFLLGTIFLLVKIPIKAENVKKLRSQNLAFQMTTQDEALLIQDLKNTEEERERLKTVFPNETEFLKFVNIIDKIKDSEVEVLKFSVDSDVPTKIGKSPSFLPITLVLSGKKEEVERALKMISDSKYFIKTINYSQEYINKEEKVTVQTQFHLFVSDDFSKVNS